MRTAAEDDFVIGGTSNDNNTLRTEVLIPLKYFSNFRRSLELPLINCEIQFDLSWSKECITSEISITPAVPGYNNTNLK